MAHPTPYPCDRTEQQLELPLAVEVHNPRSLAVLEYELACIGWDAEACAECGDLEAFGDCSRYAFELSRQIVQLREGRA